MARPVQFSDESILCVARRYFLEQGAGVSTSAIATEIGLSQAALFKRFGTKEKLLVEALRPPEHPEWLKRVEEGPDGRPIDVQLRDIALEATVFMRDLVPRMLVLESAGIDPEALLGHYALPPPIRALRGLAGFLTDASRQGRILAGQPEVLAMQFLGALQGRAFLCHMFDLDDLSTDDLGYAEQMVAHLWQGIRPGAAPSEAT